MVQYSSCDMFADWKFKMADITKLSLTLDPMGISFSSSFLFLFQPILADSSAGGLLPDLCNWF